MDIFPNSARTAGMTYAEYRSLAIRLLQAGKTTASMSEHPGVEESDSLLEYTRLNEQRMSRIEKTFRLDPETAALLHDIRLPIEGWVLTESWCGDAAQILPVLEQLAVHQPLIQLRYLLRDQHPALMDAFLTDGGKAIPKVIWVDPATQRIIGQWGPRPAIPQSMMQQFKAEMQAAPDQEAREAVYERAKTAVHTWYAHDKTVSTQREVAGAVLAVQKLWWP